MADIRKEVAEVRQYYLALKETELSDQLVEGMGTHIKYMEKAHDIIRQMVAAGINKKKAGVFSIPRVNPKPLWLEPHINDRGSLTVECGNCFRCLVTSQMEFAIAASLQRDSRCRPTARSTRKSTPGESGGRIAGKPPSTSNNP